MNADCRRTLVFRQQNGGIRFSVADKLFGREPPTWTPRTALPAKETDMSTLSRRNAVKVAAGLAVGAAALTARETLGDAEKTDEAKPTTDLALEQALKNPQMFMFSEQITFKIEGDGYSRDLFITSARNTDGYATEVRVPAGSMRIFRADANVDEFTKSGGIYWKFFDKTGKAQFKQASALVMIVRDRDETVRCYSLMYDFRC
jgi:hypothetical protein